ncbi:MAG: hypothetical protein O2958_01880 [Gemmatimonadetes bacterium]|nr:hypothetical protein [Gemmatimonadota bacterium]
MMIVGVPNMTEAQLASWQDVQVADIEDMGSKFMQLAEAFGESQYNWRPMEGVRSVREVLGLAIAEAHLFPTGWGYEAAPGAARGFGPELERAGALSKAAMVVELETSFRFLSGVVSTMSEEKRLSDGSYFGRAMPVHASVATAMADMHEHLGQLIAYARANHVVPPWSAGND